MISKMRPPSTNNLLVWLAVGFLVLAMSSTTPAAAFILPPPSPGSSTTRTSQPPSCSALPATSDESLDESLSPRRNFIVSAAGAVAGLVNSKPAVAAADCFKDCFSNCKKIAPQNEAYCRDQCTDYCAQDDRQDGLSGSVSSNGGEVGILGRGTVPKGQDKPPSVSLPGLDFVGSDKGRQLLGY